MHALLRLASSAHIFHVHLCLANCICMYVGSEAVDGGGGRSDLAYAARGGGGGGVVRASMRYVPTCTRGHRYSAQERKRERERERCVYRFFFCENIYVLREGDRERVRERGRERQGVSLPAFASTRALNNPRPPPPPPPPALVRSSPSRAGL